MPLNFPDSPSLNESYTFNNKTWTYNGNAWALAYSSLTTSFVSEGSNLYFTNARATAAVTDTTLSNSTISGNVNASSALFTANVALGNIRLRPGGAVTFADGTRQNTAATTGLTTGKSIAMAIIFGG